MESYQQITLAVDEMIDEGIVINTDSENLEGKIYLRDAKASSSGSSSSYDFNSVNIIDNLSGSHLPRVS